MWGTWPVGVPVGWFTLWPQPQRSGLRSVNSWAGRDAHDRDDQGWYAQQQPAACDRALALARHPSFTPQSAVRIARTLDGRGLSCVWACSGDLLRTPSTADRRVAYVILRAAVLDEMEARDPAAFARWFADATSTTPPRRIRRRPWSRLWSRSPWAPHVH